MVLLFSTSIRWRLFGSLLFILPVEAIGSISSASASVWEREFMGKSHITTFEYFWPLARFLFSANALKSMESPSSSRAMARLVYGISSLKQYSSVTSICCRLRCTFRIDPSCIYRHLHLGVLLLWHVMMASHLTTSQSTICNRSTVASSHQQHGHRPWNSPFALGYSTWSHCGHAAWKIFLFTICLAIHLARAGAHIGKESEGE